MKKLYMIALVLFLSAICLHGFKPVVFAQSELVDSLKQDAQYIAIVVDLKGKAFIKRFNSSDFKPTQWGAYLYQGDEIKVGDSSRVSLLYSGGLLLTLVAHSQMTMDVHPGASNEPITTDINEKYKVVPQFKKFKLFEAIAPQAVTYTGSDGILRLGSEPREVPVRLELISPRNTHIIEQYPVFRWESIYKNAEYVVTLLDPDSNTIWEKRTQDLYLKSSKKLKRGKAYLWSVTVYRDFQKVSLPVTSNFKVLPEADYQNYRNIMNRLGNLKDDQRTETFSNFLYGIANLKYDLVEQATPFFKKIAESNPNSLTAHEALSRLYWDQGFVGKADTEFQIWKNLLRQK